MRGRDKILYWDLGKSSFVLKDLDILRSEFTVVDFTFKAKKSAALFLEFLKQFFISFYYVFSCRIVICQFSGYHSFIPMLIFKLFGRKRMIVAGGTDCVSFPSIRYGNFYKKYLRWFTARSFRLANVISPVDKTLIKYKYTYQPEDGGEQGYRAHVKDLKATDKVIYNGYDPVRFRITSTERKKGTFLTVAADLNTRFAPKLKGIDLIIEMANRLKDFDFTIVGGHVLQLDHQPPNLHLVGNIDNAGLIEIYNRNEFYLQLSMSEGFPNALCEAMLCGCIPVVSNVGAMPMIAGELGYVLSRKDPGLLEALLQKAVADERDAAKKEQVRTSIIERFGMEKRKSELTELVRNLIEI